MQKDSPAVKHPEYFTSPPMLPGEKVFPGQHYCNMYPVHDPKDPTKVTQWMVAAGSLNPDNKSYKQIKIADGSVSWRSILERVTNTESGHEIGCILDADSLYTLTYDKNKSPTFKKTARLDPQQGRADAVCTFLDRIYPDQGKDLTKAPAHRLIFGRVSGKDGDIFFYDAYDAKFSLHVSLKKVLVKRIYKIFLLANRSKSYLGFATLVTDPASKQVQTQLYFIGLDKMTNAVRQSKTLSEDDFGIHTLQRDGNANGNYLRDLVVKQFYLEKNNLGSQQVAAYFGPISQGSTRTGAVTLISLDEKEMPVTVLEPSEVLQDQVPLDEGEGDFNPFSGEGWDPYDPGCMEHFIEGKGTHCFLILVRLVNKYTTRYSDVSPGYAYRSGSRLIVLRAYPSDKEGVAMNPLYHVTTYTVWTTPNDKKFLPGPPYVPHKPYTYTNFPVTLQSSFTLLHEVEEKDKKFTFKIRGIRFFYRAAYVLYEGRGLGLYKQVKQTGSPVFFRTKSVPLKFDGDGVVQPFGTANPPFGTAEVTDIISSDETDTSGNLFQINAFFQGGSVDKPGYPSSGNNYMSNGIDFLGEAIYAGSPRVSYDDSALQVIGIYQCMPFHDDVQKNQPSLMISSSQSVMDGINKSLHTTWHAGFTASAGVSGSLGHVDAHYGKSWGGSKMHMKSDQKTISLHVTTGISDEDAIHSYGSTFYIWQYPLFHKAKLDDSQIGYMTVVMPDGFEDAMLDSKDSRLGYYQDYEIGNILTYVNASKPGYDAKNLWFTKELVTCTSDSQGGGNTVTYSKMNSTHTEEQSSHEDSMNAGASVGVHVGIFRSSVNTFYTKSNIKNAATSTTRTDEFSVTFHTGMTSEEGYEYTVTPIIYTHKDTNLLIINSNVQLTGALWKKKFQIPNIIMMRLYPFAKDDRLKRFTRSIQFKKNEKGNIDIDLHLFSCSYSPARKIVCTIYEGMAIYLPGKQPDVSKLKKLGVLNVDSMDSLERDFVTLKDQKLADKTEITVEIFHDDLEDINKAYYWGVYPYSAFANSSLKYDLKEG